MPRKALILTIPAVGHILPAATVIKKLAEEGYSADIICEKRYAAYFHSHGASRVFTIKGCGTHTRLKGIQALLFLKLFYYNRIVGDLADSHLERERYDLLLSDMFMLAGPPLASKHGIGYAAICPIIWPFRTGADPAYNIPAELPRAMNVVLNGIFGLLLDSFAPVIGSFYRKYGVKVKSYGWRIHTGYEKIYVTIPEKFHAFMRAKPRNMIFLDHIPEDRPLFKGGIRLKEDAKYIIISLGTVFYRTSRIRSIVKKYGLKKFPHKIIVLGDSERTEDGVQFMKGISLNEILPYASLFITHGGINSLLAAYHHRVRTLILPQSAEQFENKRIFKKILEDI